MKKEKANISVRLDKELVDKINALSKRSGKRRCEIIEFMLRSVVDYVDVMDETAETERE